jgi:hypothetical protein
MMGKRDAVRSRVIIARASRTLTLYRFVHRQWVPK